MARPVGLSSNAHEGFANRLNKLFDGAIWPVETYKGCGAPIKFECSLGHSTIAQPRVAMKSRGNGCATCSELSRGQKAGAGRFAAAHARFLARVAAKHGTAITVLSEYAGSKADVLIRCDKGHEYETKAEYLYQYGCRYCGKIKSVTAYKSKYVAQYDAQLYAKYQGRVTALEPYQGSYTSIKHRCQVHGEFEASPQALLHRNSFVGCTRCNLDERGLRHRVTEAEVHKRIAARHGGTVQLVDPYTGSQIKHTFRCTTCEGTWLANPDSVVRTSGCPHCNNPLRHSKVALAWIEAVSARLGLEFEHAGNGGERHLYGASGKRYYVDGYHEARHIVLEFNGDCWHGNPAVYPPDARPHPWLLLSAGELAQRTRAKTEDLVRAGYQVVSVWERDWRSGRLHTSLDVPLRLGVPYDAS